MRCLAATDWRRRLRQDSVRVCTRQGPECEPPPHLLRVHVLNALCRASFRNLCKSTGAVTAYPSRGRASSTRTPAQWPTSCAAPTSSSTLVTRCVNNISTAGSASKSSSENRRQTRLSPSSRIVAQNPTYAAEVLHRRHTQMSLRPDLSEGRCPSRPPQISGTGIRIGGMSREGLASRGSISCHHIWR